MSNVAVAPMRRLRATVYGWRRRPDMGPRVWETSNGALFNAEDDSEPVLNILAGIRDWKIETK